MTWLLTIATAWACRICMPEPDHCKEADWVFLGTPVAFTPGVDETIQVRLSVDVVALGAPPEDVVLEVLARLAESGEEEVPGIKGYAFLGGRYTIGEQVLVFGRLNLPGPTSGARIDGARVFRAVSPPEPEEFVQSWFTHCAGGAGRSWIRDILSDGHFLDY